MAQVWGVLKRVAAVVLLCALVFNQLRYLANSILPPAFLWDNPYYCLLVWGFVPMMAGAIGPWSWVQIPRTFVLLASSVVLGGGGWVTERARQGFPVRFLVWQPRFSPLKLSVLLALAGVVCPAVLMVWDHVTYLRSDLLPPLGAGVLPLLLLTVPTFLAGGLLAALLDQANKSEWWAGVMGAMGLAAGWRAFLLACVSEPGSVWGPLAAIAALLSLGAIVAFGYALKSTNPGNTLRLRGEAGG